MRSLLDHQADGIEYTLHSHGIEATVEGGNISPRLIQFHIRLGPGVKFSRLTSLGDELALALGVVHCRITRDGYTVKLEVPRPDPVAVQLFPLMRTMPGELPELAPILGLDENGVPLLLKLSSPDISHILITGTTGSGKTTLARSMIASLALQNSPEQLRLMLIDPKRRGYGHFNGLPNLVCPVISDPLDALHRLKWAVRHLEKRDETGISTPMLVIFIDELAELVLAMGRDFEQVLGRLTQRGREAGIHVIASCQKASAQSIGTIARSNFPTRVVGRVMTSEDARAATGVNASGAEKLMGQGDFLLYARDAVTRLQAAHLSQEEMVQTVIHLGGQPESLGRETHSQRVIEPAFQYPSEQPESYHRAFKPQPEPDEATDRSRNYNPSQYAAEGETLGVAERLARYQTAIQQSRRAQPQPPEYEQPQPVQVEKPRHSDSEPLTLRPRRQPESENPPIDEPEFTNNGPIIIRADEFRDAPSSKSVSRPIEPSRPAATPASRPPLRPTNYDEPEDLWNGSNNHQELPPERPAATRPNSDATRQPTPVKPVAKVQTQTEQPRPTTQPRPVTPSKPTPILNRTFNPIPKPRVEAKSKAELDEMADEAGNYPDAENGGIEGLTRDGGKNLIDTLKNRAVVRHDPDDLPKF